MLTLVVRSVVESRPCIPMAWFRNAQACREKLMKRTLQTQFEVDRSVPTKMEVTPLLQVSAGLPSSAEPFAERLRSAGLLRDYRVYGDQPVDREKPTSQTHEMICRYFYGMADEGELQAHKAKLHRPAEP